MQAGDCFERKGQNMVQLTVGEGGTELRTEQGCFLASAAVQMRSQVKPRRALPPSSVLCQVRNGIVVLRMS